MNLMPPNQALRRARRPLSWLLCAALLLALVACDRRSEIPPPDSRGVPPELAPPSRSSPPSSPSSSRMPASSASAMP